MKENFGDYIVFLRKNKLQIDVSRQMAEKLEITAQYMHDIENNNRVPSEKILKRMENVFNLDKEEKEKMYDLASTAYKEKKVPADIANYIISNSEARSKIRKMMNEDKNEEVK